MSKKILILPILSLCISCMQVEKESEYVLWYDRPAEVWEEALPIGNGRLGAMIYGGTGEEIVQFNEETVWAGEPGNNIPAGFSELLPRVRELVFQGRYREAEELAMSRIPRYAAEDNNYGMAYQPVGNLKLTFPGHDEPLDYRRELDIENALSRVQYRIDGVDFRREYLASAVDQVIMISLTASEKGRINCSLELDSPHEQWNAFARDGQLVLEGVSGDQDNKKGSVRFESRVMPVLKGGSLEVADSILLIRDADEVSLFLSVGTNFNHYSDITGDAGKRAIASLEALGSRDPDEIREDHIRDYRFYFDRVKLDLGSSDSVKNPTDRRLVDFASGNDPQLAALYFQFGRYLLISSSRPGGQPANLQGIWNDRVHPPWDSKYTININTEMNYWPAELCALPELHQPLFDMIREISQTGQETAREMYGARGWVTHHNTDLWRITGPVDGASYGMWPLGGAWLSQHLWEHFLYGGDTALLQEFYPVLKGSARFYLDVLQEVPDKGWLVVNPSMSPENSHPGGSRMAAGTTMDNQILLDLFSKTIRCAEILDADGPFADSLRQVMDRLPPMQIGRHGQLQEWMEDWDRVDDKHRHVSHLYGLYPSNQISPFRDPALFLAARQSLLYRGDVSTGWSMGWKVNLWARLLDGNHAYKLITDQLSPVGETSAGGTYPNLLDAHPPFQIDGNFGCAAGIAEMLMQSHDGAIHLLPALPDAWPRGYIKGLRARGGYSLEISWKDSRLEKIVVHSELGGTCRLRLGELPREGMVEWHVAEEGSLNPNAFFRLPPVKEALRDHAGESEYAEIPGTYLIEFETMPGESYELLGKNAE